MRRILNHIRACVARRQQSRCERARVLQLPAVGAVVWRLVYIYAARLIAYMSPDVCHPLPPRPPPPPCVHSPAAWPHLVLPSLSPSLAPNFVPPACFSRLSCRRLLTLPASPAVLGLSLLPPRILVPSGGRSLLSAVAKCRSYVTRLWEFARRI